MTRPVPAGAIARHAPAAGWPVAASTTVVVIDAPPVGLEDRLQAELRWPQKIRTQIEPASTFWEAEDYQQQYFEKQGRTSCHAGLRAA